MIQHLIVAIIGIGVILYVVRAVIRLIRRDKKVSCCGCSGCEKRNSCYKVDSEKKEIK